MRDASSPLGRLAPHFTASRPFESASSPNVLLVRHSFGFGTTVDNGCGIICVFFDFSVVFFPVVVLLSQQSQGLRVVGVPKVSTITGIVRVGAAILVTV